MIKPRTVVIVLSIFVLLGCLTSYTLKPQKTAPVSLDTKLVGPTEEVQFQTSLTLVLSTEIREKVDVTTCSGYAIVPLENFRTALQSALEQTLRSNFDEVRVGNRESGQGLELILTRAEVHPTYCSISFLGTLRHNGNRVADLEGKTLDMEFKVASSPTRFYEDCRNKVAVPLTEEAIRGACGLIARQILQAVKSLGVTRSGEEAGTLREALEIAISRSATAEPTPQRTNEPPVPNPELSPRLFQAVLAALRSGKTEAVTSLLQMGADPNALEATTLWRVKGKEVRIRKPLFFVLLYDNLGAGGTPEPSLKLRLQILSLLKEAGANLDAQAEDGETSLDYLLMERADSKKETKQQQIELIVWLVENGVNPNKLARSVDMGEPLGVRNWDPPLFQVLVNRDFDPREKTQLIRLFLEAGADVNVRNKDQEPFFHALLRHTELDGYRELIVLGLRAGANARLLDKWGNNALGTLYSTFQFNKRMLELLDLLDVLVRAGVDLDLPDEKGQTLLFRAAYDRDISLSAWLLDRGANPGIRDKDGNQALHAMFLMNYSAIPLELVRMFVTTGVDLNAQGNSGNTVLFLAAKNDTHHSLVQFLVEKGADINIPNDDEVTPLGIARQLKAQKNAAFLESRGGVPYISRYPTGNEAAACRAILSGDLPALRSVPLQEFSQMVARTSFGVPATPLHLAAEQGTIQVVRALCERKVDWNVGDRYGRTPLELAVKARNVEVVGVLLQAGADPNRQGDWGESPLSVAIAAGSPLTQSMLASGGKPKLNEIALATGACGSLDLVRQLTSLGTWNSDSLDIFVGFGRFDILEAIADAATHETKDRSMLLAEARSRDDAIRKEEAEWSVPLEGRHISREAQHKKGSYILTLEAWSPWIESDPDIDLIKYPVTVYVPKGYDGSKPYGLIVSMMNPQSASQAPKPEYLATLEKHNLLYVGFDPYNGIFDDGSRADSMFLNHERLVLAAAYHLLGAYNVDRSRVYLAGFSWGGRLTGEIVPNQSRLFTGGIAVGGCFTTGGRVLGIHPTARKKATIVLCTGDFDYNRKETYAGYCLFTAFGYEAYFMQEPKSGHARISAKNFEKAVSLLDAAAAARK